MPKSALWDILQMASIEICDRCVRTSSLQRSHKRKEYVSRIVRKPIHWDWAAQGDCGAALGQSRSAMTGEGEELRSTAVRNLHALGLSEYAARTLVALTRIGGGSAREVSDTSSVPRTRVYDAVDELADRGFVRVQESHPKAFVPVSPQRIRRAFYREYIYRQVVAEFGLRAIGSSDGEPGGRDMSLEAGTETVNRRFLAEITEAEQRVTYVSVGGVPSDDVLSALEDATDRDVSVRVVLVGERDAGVSDAIPAATVLTVQNTATPPNDRSRFLLVDDSVALLGTWTDGQDGPAEIGLFSERGGTDVAMLLQQVVDTWLADAE